MESLVVLLSAQQPPGHSASNVMIGGAAILIILAIRAAGRSVQPFSELLKAAARIGLALVLAIAALALVVLSLFA
ncbi:hypothetical protein GCM10010168_17870 [Actinoplanes ianthinogenes]|uniref:Uncharacterized protein n=1 Tax=Actinoplanes ianthinogenes TaxID=122358 RepID=A0ABN6CS39_9ACTN|nr:hypothetical protein [Actinoplanes ianthinogenes]BCJ47429.1 hypothetical protein Aiant_80860 [Actinoplanes ianthinogenes]GGR01728.1 hypothetical protein GCM10010168_17870 [Actinoplanes ianthinogenes]